MLLLMGKLFTFMNRILSPSKLKLINGELEDIKLKIHRKIKSVMCFSPAFFLPLVD
jgi:hypothetical protein